MNVCVRVCVFHFSEASSALGGRIPKLKPGVLLWIHDKDSVSAMQLSGLHFWGDSCVVHVTRLGVLHGDYSTLHP